MERQRKKTRQRKTRQRKTSQDNVFDIIVGFAQAVDTVFERLTGKPLASWFNEFQQRPRELPEGETATPPESAMPLADAYMVMGLSATATMAEVNERYRALARLFHPDAPGGYSEAMRLLNNARDRITKVKKI